MKIFIFLLYWLIGAVSVYGSCYIIVRVFRCKLRRHTLFSILAGMLPMLCELIYYLIRGSIFPFNGTALLAVYIPLIWFFVTDRSLKSLIVSASGLIFSECTALILNIPAGIVLELLSRQGASAVVILIGMLSGKLLTLALLVLIGRIGSSVTEPMSAWNIIFMALLAFFTKTITLLYLGEAESLSGKEMLSAAGMSLLAVAFILISVLMTVKFTESRYYSTLNSMNESYLNAQKDYYDIKQRSDTEIRRIKHDMKNHLICIRDLAAQGRYDELDSYIGEISEAVSSADRLIHTGSGIIDAIVNEKAATAKKLGVRFEWEGTVSGLTISAVDSCTLVSNLLDNALEACDKVDVAKRYISLSFRRSEHFLLMTCENSAPRVVELADGRPLTTKSDKYEHGFGLGNIERCVVKYGGHLDLSSYLEDGEPVFKSEAVIPLEYD